MIDILYTNYMGSIWNEQGSSCCDTIKIAGRQANLTGHISVLVKCLALKTIVLKSCAFFLNGFVLSSFFFSSGRSRRSGTLDLIPYSYSSIKWRRRYNCNQCCVNERKLFRILYTEFHLAMTTSCFFLGLVYLHPTSMSFTWMFTNKTDKLVTLNHTFWQRKIIFDHNSLQNKSTNGML